MTQSTVTIEGLTKLANDLLVQNTAIRNKLDKVETQRDELLDVIGKMIGDLHERAYHELMTDPKHYSASALKQLIAKAEDYAKNPANYQHSVVVSEPIGISLSTEEAELFKAFITGEQHD